MPTSKSSLAASVHTMISSDAPTLKEIGDVCKYFGKYVSELTGSTVTVKLVSVPTTKTKGALPELR